VSRRFFQVHPIDAVRTHRVNETSEYQYHGQKVRITYVHQRDYFIISINDRLFPQYFTTKAAALKEAFRLLTDEEAES
jgi:hypothetical protein